MKIVYIAFGVNFVFCFQFARKKIMVTATHTKHCGCRFIMFYFLRGFFGSLKYQTGYSSFLSKTIYRRWLSELYKSNQYCYRYLLTTAFLSTIRVKIYWICRVRIPLCLWVYLPFSSSGNGHGFTPKNKFNSKISTKIINKTERRAPNSIYSRFNQYVYINILFKQSQCFFNVTHDVTCASRESSSSSSMNSSLSSLPSTNNF